MESKSTTIKTTSPHPLVGKTFSIIIGCIIGFYSMVLWDTYVAGWTERLSSHYKHINFLRHQSCTNKAKTFVAQLEDISPMKTGITITGRHFWNAWIRVVYLNDGKVSPFCDQEKEPTNPTK